MPTHLVTTKARTRKGTWNIRVFYESGKSAQVDGEMRKYIGVLDTTTVDGALRRNSERTSFTIFSDIPPVNEQLNINKRHPTKTGIVKAIKSMKSGKADSVTARILQPLLHEIWEQKLVPPD